ncbi:hypothetical protein AO726_14215 [Pseudomonas sp. TTU2014-080ASC]|nr:hypothetical protein AO726_14215 [Pseudomonas sp. TTU2014-080ASC]
MWNSNCKFRWGSCLALLLLGALMWASTGEASQERAGLIAIFALSLFISLGFILFGREHIDSKSDPVVRKE